MKRSESLRRRNLLRPAIYVPREDWERMEQAVAVVNYQRAKDGEPPISRTDVIGNFIKQWSEKKLG